MNGPNGWMAVFAAVVLTGCGGAVSLSLDKPVTTNAASAAYGSEIEIARALIRDAAEPSAGVAIAVFRAGELVWLEGIGHADVEARTPVDPERTLFRIYSVAKPITATAALRLAESGSIDPETPIHRYVPGLPDDSAPITAMQLATHTSGIRHYANDAEASGLVHCRTVDDALSTFIEDPLVHAPGEKETYSSWGYVLLSAVVSAASDAPFLTAMQRLVFEPAGLTSIVADDPLTSVPGHGSFYEEVGGFLSAARPVDNTCKWGAGGLRATAHDVGRFGAAMLDGHTLMSPQSLQLFLRGADVYRAMGVGIGGTAFLLIDSASDLSISLLSNTSGDSAGPRLQDALDDVHALFRGR